MIAFQLVELLLDYILDIDFRSIRWMTIVYVTLFFGATGGMIGVASHAGRGWTAVTGTTFLVMAGLAFYQRAKTGALSELVAFSGFALSLRVRRGARRSIRAQ
jgi:hypothetical protein